ncbi:MAG: polysaccharide biosynthesis C-terminal domain-containing protein, partial [Clostridia bacterium]|nr:polysaccharide biosynthesis C-terminal domain-containing protein [Clostridia bacterium]
YSLLLISQSLEQIQYWFHAQYLSKYVSIVSFCAYLLISIYKIALLATEKGIYWFAVSNSIDHLVIAISLFVIYKVKKGQKLKFSVGMVKTLWDKGRHYILPELMGLVLAQSDRIMLRFMCGDSEVGLYSAAYSICVMTSFVFSAIITSFRPLILQAKVESAEEYEHSIIKLYGIIIYLSLLQSVCVSIFNPLIINILYGESYISAVPILFVIIWYTPFSYIGSVRTVWVLAEDKQKYLWIISFTGMVLNIALNLVLIPFLKGTGAAIATLATQIFTNIIIVSLVKPLRINIKYILKSFNLKRIIK